MLSLNLPGLFMSPVSSNGFRQWLWCGNMEKNLGMNLGKGFLGVHKVSVPAELPHNKRTRLVAQVPLLGGAFCACTCHFFYNSESLEVLVALQAALIVVGNFTMSFATPRIYKSCEGELGTQ
ncbi:uncharacterized protein LOC122059420 isoform X1 [Macadamia integrifolia]|uniref:uncharacterized protein LOC122059420 isoform X1 n=1 Tax=Macadamia integrifolia TaxID=60698 RepID=UPI001C529674|nr:uncharacterized protein LOC122059420 isoform X1 [Macadamia integrifolia]